MVHEYSLEPDEIEHSSTLYDMLTRTAAIKIDQAKISRLMKGTIDLHVHAAPEAYAGRPWDEIDIARRGCAEGMAAIVFKCHSAPTAARAPLVQKVVDEWAEANGKERLDVIGGVALNRAVGGLNPEAVRACAKFGGKFVWTPVLHSSHHQRAIGQKGGVEVVDEHGKVLPAMKEIMKLISDNDMVLSISHQSTAERFALIEEAKKAGIRRILIDHPQLSITKASSEQLSEMASMGATIGFYWQAVMPNVYNFKIKPLDVLETIKKIGPDNLASGTDLVQFGNPHPVDGMRLFLTVLLSFSVGEDMIKKIFVENPRRLLY